MKDIWIIENLDIFLQDPQYNGYVKLCGVDEEYTEAVIQACLDSWKAVLLEPRNPFAVMSADKE